MRRFLGFLSLLSILGCSSGGSSLSGISQMVGSGGGQVMSADGDLTLDIPAGALPADTEITIRKLAPSQLGPAFEGADVAAAYELGPDGLTFQQPVTVTLRLDQQPVDPGGVLQAQVVALVTESDAGIEAADAQVLTGDGDAGLTTVTGEIGHFSRLVGVKDGITVEASGIPDRLALGMNFTVDVSADLSDDARQFGTLVLGAWGDAPTLPEVSIETSFGEVSSGHYSTSLGPISCASLGKGRVNASAEIRNYFPSLAGPQLILDFKLVLWREVIHTGEAALVRTFHLTLIALEAAGVIPAPVPGLVPDPESAVTVPGKEACAVINVDTGAELGRVSTPPGATYGGILLAEGGVLAAGEVYALFAHGDWGAALYYWDGSVFGAPVMLTSNHITDAVRTPGGGLLFADNTAGQVRFLELAGGAYQVAALAMDLPDVISATQLPDGSILAVTSGTGGGLYTAASREATLLLVSQIADSLRRVRALDDVAAISYFGGGVGFGGISVAARNNAGVWGLVFGLIGTSSIGIDLKAATNGHLLIAATSYNTNEYRVIEVEADGNYWTDSLVALPAGCEAPGHALWLPDSNELAVTCHDSDTLAVIPVD